MIRPNNGKTGDKYGPVRGVPGATNKPLPPVYKQSPQYMGPFVQGANQQTRIMGWDGVREQGRPRDPKSDGVPPAQMINPLGKVGGGGALPSMTAKQRPVQQPIRQPPPVTMQPMYQQQPQQPQQPTYQPQPTAQQQQRPQPVSMQNFIQPLNQPAARVPTSQPTKQPVGRSPMQAPQPSRQQQSQTLPTRQPQQQPQQAPPPPQRNELLEAIRKEIGELQQQVEQMKDNTEQIYELQDGLGKLIQKVESIEWDSFSFEADVAIAGGVEVWEELPSDTMDIHFQNIKPNESPRKIFKDGERVRIHYPLAEFNVEMPDGSLQKWRFGRARIFKTDGWLLDDVYFPLEISASLLLGSSHPDSQDFSLVTTVANIRV